MQRSAKLIDRERGACEGPVLSPRLATFASSNEEGLSASRSSHPLHARKCTCLLIPFSALENVPIYLSPFPRPIRRPQKKAAGAEGMVLTSATPCLCQPFHCFIRLPCRIR